MMATHRSGSQEARAHAEDTARTLLNYAELPLLIRASACMILGCSTSAGYVGWAREAVRIAELGFNNATNPGVVEQDLINSGREVLKWALNDYAENGGDQHESGRGQRMEDEPESASQEPLRGNSSDTEMRDVSAGSAQQDTGLPPLLSAALPPGLSAALPTPAPTSRIHTSEERGIAARDTAHEGATEARGSEADA